MRQYIFFLSLIRTTQPAKAFIWCFITVFFGTFVLGLITRSTWVFSIGTTAAFLSFTLFGYCLFRDINTAATTVSRVYKERRSIAPERFTFFDVPTLKSLGFFQMMLGALFVVVSVVELIQR